ncbi:5-aminovalerate aminotransferase DavT [Fundidesulfovibrio magnetotacticus]|uniref:5-aminovalerate aminotransferase DavT n=1 Tax=Fundidesulfovibrio magnetotacticus TaxID=2730080 RepID=A0A6V8LWJ5_9BACT|nr:4-aminobutyrate--2-oxoglutarate transaminase [Fundidesulfovibrio magnetotacticus]GFK96104.1 5-aminovalerate aminotransferase DavT [Fundidesulfovibrio magnetotacticus]
MAQHTDKTQELLALRDRYVPKGPFNVTRFLAAKASGAVITDMDGRELIDFAGGIGVVNVGHCHPKVSAAVKDQADKYIHTCFHIVMYEPYIRLAEKLCTLAPGDFEKMAILANSGAEAVENAVKIARSHTKRQGVIVFEGGFHGRTLLTMSMTSKVKPYKFGFGPFAPEVYRMPYAYCYRCPIGLDRKTCDAACADLLNDFFIGHAAAESVACLVAEPVLGEGGFVTPPTRYFEKLSAICRANGIVYVADEVQTGFGRTGEYFAMTHHGVAADLVTVAKSMGGGMPISGVVGRAEIMDAPQIGGTGGTYGGNPVSCRAALAVLEVFEEEKLLERARTLGATLQARFAQWMERYEIIGEERGLGPMRALELVTDREKKTPAMAQAKALVKYCVDRGLLLLSCGTHGNVIRTLMPLVITDEQLERGLAILEEGFQEIAKGRL